MVKERRFVEEYALYYIVLYGQSFYFQFRMIEKEYLVFRTSPIKYLHTGTFY